MKKRFLALTLAGGLMIGTLTGCSSAIKDSDVALTVEKEEVTAGVANFYARYTQAQYETYYAEILGEDMWNSEAEKGKTYEESVKDSVQKDLEDMILLEAHMKEYDVTLTDEEKAVIKKAAADFDEVNGLEEKEKVSGADTKTVERVLTLMAIREKMAGAIKAGADTEVADEEAAQKSMQYVFFSYKNKDEEGNTTELSDDEKAAMKAQAESFAEGVKAADFETFAGEQSLEVSTATFDKEVTVPTADLCKEADALAEGETTGVVETEDGCYVAKVTSLFDQAATDSKKQSIVEERKNELYTDTCKKWRKEAEIEVHKNVWRKIDFNDLKVTMKMMETDPYADQVQTDDVAEGQ